jgi:transposase
LLWQEYREQQPNGYGYSRYCGLYRSWLKRQDVVLRHEHRAGEKLFVDYAGDTIAVYDPATGEARPAAVFVAVLGASSYTYAEATWTQGLADWIGAHLRTFEFFGGTPEILVLDFVSGYKIESLLPAALCGLGRAEPPQSRRTS